MTDTVLVTGGAGFIGSHLVEHLAKTHNVVALDDLSGGTRDNLIDDTRVQFHEMSVNDPLDQLFREYKFSQVFHFAAYAAEGLSHHIRKFNYENNVVGSANVINACVKHGVDRLVFASSIAVYGDGKPPFYETMQCDPCDPYGVAKYAVEMDLAVAARHYGLEYTVFRPHNVYGERQNICDPFRNVVGIFLRNACRGDALPIFGDGTQSRAFTYVRDIIGPIVDAATDSRCINQTFDIGGQQVYTVNELAAAVGKALDVSVEKRYLPERPEAKHAYATHEKIKHWFPSMCQTSLSDGLAAMAEQVAISLEHGKTQLPALEVADWLPDSWRMHYSDSVSLQ